MSNKHRKFGWKPNLPSQSDLKYAAHREMQAAPFVLPPLVDLRPQMSPIEDQGQLGSCVAHATVGTLEYLELQELKDGKGGKEVFPGKQFVPISRLFVYYNARAIDHNQYHDEGTTLRNAMSAIQKWGICQESYWPYYPQNVNVTPTFTAYREGSRHIILNHYSLDNTQIVQLKYCLAMGYPFIFGMTIYESFMSEQSKLTGIIPIPSASEQMLGGHALCCVGYDDAKKSFLIRNSWGTGWGLDGYCYMPFNMLTSLNYSSDFWTLRKE